MDAAPAWACRVAFRSGRWLHSSFCAQSPSCERTLVSTSQSSAVQPRAWTTTSKSTKARLPLEHWHLVHTKPNRECWVAVQLHQRGFAVYLPLIWVSPVNPRASRERAYFPCCLFARLDIQSVGRHVFRWWPGVQGLIEFGDEPVAISDTFVSELRQRLGQLRAVGEMGVDGERRANEYSTGHGPFKSYEGIFNPRLLGADRTRILLACIQQDSVRPTMQTQIPASD